MIGSSNNSHLTLWNSNWPQDSPSICIDYLKLANNKMGQNWTVRLFSCRFQSIVFFCWNFSYSIAVLPFYCCKRLKIYNFNSQERLQHCSYTSAIKTNWKFMSSFFRRMKKFILTLLLRVNYCVTKTKTKIKIKLWKDAFIIFHSS